jgi:hypothetical protein
MRIMLLITDMTRETGKSFEIFLRLWRRGLPFHILQVFHFRKTPGNSKPPAPTARSQTSLGQRPRYQQANIKRAESPFHPIADAPFITPSRTMPDG